MIPFPCSSLITAFKKNQSIRFAPIPSHRQWLPHQLLPDTGQNGQAPPVLVSKSSQKTQKNINKVVKRHKKYPKSSQKTQNNTQNVINKHKKYSKSSQKTQNIFKK